MKGRMFVIAIVCVSLLSLGTARAQTASPVVVYPAGWNMVAGPSGTDFSAAGGLFAYSGGQYISPAQRQSIDCTGYWAYFFQPRSVTLAPQTATAENCALVPGWNLVGNPFDGVASLPPGTTGYVWDPAAAVYDSIIAIPAGNSAWIYSVSGGSISLATPTPVPTPQPQPTLTITASSPGSLFTVHVGDTIQLQAPYVSEYLATWDTHYLQLIQEADQGELTCVGEPVCEFNFTYRFWIWRAIQPGTTPIVLNPGCLAATPPCAAPSRAFQITILP